MKYSFLSKIVKEHANQLEQSAAYGGFSNDGGKANVLKRLDDYHYKFVVDMDLRPSEFHQIDDLEVGEPAEFRYIIENYKISLAKNIIL